MARIRLSQDWSHRVREALVEFVDAADEVIFEGNMDYAEPMLAAYVKLRNEMGREAVAKLRQSLDQNPLFAFPDP